MTFVIQGLRITADCRYIRFVQSDRFEIKHEPESDSMTIYFKKGMTSDDIKSPSMILIEDKELVEMDYTKISVPVINLDGLVFTKLAQTPYVFKQFVVGDVDKFIMKYSDSRCEIIIPDRRTSDIDCYRKLLSNNPYIKLLNGCPKELHTVESVLIQNKDVQVKSSNSTVYNTKKKYSKYRVSSVMVHSSFIEGVKNILADYGLELLSIPIDKNTASTHRVTYRFTDIGKQSSPKSVGLWQHMQRKVDHVEFKLSTPDLTLLNDFKVRYQNLDLLTPFTEFKVRDKLGEYWSEVVWWNPISTDFDQNYATDEQGNIGFEVSFSADIHYDTVYDEQMIKIQEVINSLIANEELTLVTIE